MSDIFIIDLSILLFIHVQICTYFQNDSIEFVSLERLSVPRVQTLPDSESIPWE